MGKCSICGKKIEYNNYKVIGGKIYCPDCIPKKEAEEIAEVLMKTVKDSKIKFDTLEEALAKTAAIEEEEVVKAEELGKVLTAADKERKQIEEEIIKAAEEEAEEQFEKEMAGHGAESGCTCRSCRPDLYKKDAEEKPKKRKRGKKKE